MPDHEVLPLAGIRVADFSTVMAGPYCTRILARLGADVIKIESPAGDYTRAATPMRGSSSAYFAELNNGKRSIVLDLKHKAGQTAARALIDASDIVVENMRVGSMARLGLDYPTVSRDHTELVYCSITGFGQDDPAADRAATAQVVQAMVGYDRAFAGYQPGHPAPPATGLYAADGMAGALAVSAILAALRVRDLTGTGRHVDVALDHALLSMMIYEVQTAQFPPDFIRKGYRPVRTRDGHVMVAAVTQRNYVGLCEAIGRPELIRDQRFAETGPRWRSYDDLHAIVEEWSEDLTSTECERRLLSAGVPASRYRTVRDYLAQPATKARLMVPAKDAGGRLEVLELPFGMRRAADSSPPGATSGPKADAIRVPDLGADTREVLCEVLGDACADELIAAGAAGHARSADAAAAT